MDKKLLGKNGKKYGITPAIILNNPKYDRNLGACVRAASCFGIKQCWYSGNRIRLDEGQRLPREERMRGYSEVELIQYDYPFDQFENSVPVALELVPGSESLTTFKHPDNAVYVFGPEDGQISTSYLRYCHRFISIPTYHCTNLAAAVYIVLYDRLLKRQLEGKDPLLSPEMLLKENRVWTINDEELG
jgi:tRNA(Leu) C34 or U34 (ribose-2'-O)-methylase TrmL